jgi:hypothetical protein
MSRARVVGLFLAWTGFCVWPASSHATVEGKSYQYIAGLASLVAPFEPGAMVFETGGVFRVDYGAEGVAGFVGTWKAAAGSWSAEFRDGVTPVTYRGVSFGQTVFGVSERGGRTALIFGSVADLIPEPPAGEYIDEVLVPSDPATAGFFGEALAISGDTVVVGAAYAEHGGLVQAGSAYVYRKVAGNWVSEGKLTASDAAAFDNFGDAVGIFGDTIAVGAYNASHSGMEQPGAVYIFHKTGGGWTQEAKLIPSDPEEFQGFGWSVAVGQDTVAVGARFDSRVADVSGAVYVFHRTGPTTWGPPQKLKESSPQYSDFFGGSVALDANTLIVGADGRKVAGQSAAGAAYVFTRSMGVWSPQAVLTASDPKEFDDFGWTVSIDGDAAVVSSRDNITVGNHSARGAAYVFRRSGSLWTQEAKLIGADSIPPDGFDHATAAIDGNSVVMGLRSDYIGYQPCGSAYVFTKAGGTWQQQAKLLPPDALVGTYFHFGIAVGLAGSTAVIGADGRGAAYVYDIAPLQSAPSTAGPASPASRSTPARRR